MVEHLEYTEPGLRMANRPAQHILGLGREMSDADISRVPCLSWKVVHKVHYEALLQKSLWHQKPAIS